MLDIHNNIRDKTSNRFCSSIAINPSSANILANTFSSIFGNWVDFSDEIIGFRTYPIKPVRNSEYGVLASSHGYNTFIQSYNVKQSWVYNMGDVYINKLAKSPDSNENRTDIFLSTKGYSYMRAFLPFLGFVDIDVDVVLKKYLHFRLALDYVTGKGMYFIGISNEEIHVDMSEDFNKLHIIDMYECAIGVDVPILSPSVDDKERNMLLSSLNIGTSLVVGNYALTTPTETFKNVNYTKRTISTTNKHKSKLNRLDQVSMDEASEVSSFNKGQVAENYSEAFSNTINALNKSFPSATIHSISNPALLSYCTNNVVLVIYTPNIIEQTEEHYRLFGHPIGYVANLSDVVGFCRVSNIRLENIKATEIELELIRDELKNGVIMPLVQG